MENLEPLIWLRTGGVIFALFLGVWTFSRYRSGNAGRAEFLLTLIFAFGLALVGVFPDSVNIFVRMLALDSSEHGRLLVILILVIGVITLMLYMAQSHIHHLSHQTDLLVRYIARNNFRQKYSDSTMGEIAVVIPAYNEEENLRELLPKMPNQILSHTCSTIVVDDGSVDDTAAVVDESDCFLAQNPINRGGGAALRLGYDIAKEYGAKIVVTMDGDGQHKPDEIVNLISPILENQADFVIGSRLLGEREKDSVVRLIGIHVFNSLINFLAHTKITDCSNGFRAFKINELNKVTLQQDQFHTAELIIDASRKNIRIGEAPVTVLRRHSGVSKKGKNLSYGINFSKTILSTWLRR